MTTKRKRKYSQDFSGGSLTDQSNPQAYDINNIVDNYSVVNDGRSAFQAPNPALFVDNEPLSFEDAMRNKAAYDSYLVENPDFLEKLSAATAAEALPDASSLSPEQPSLDVEDVGKLAPQDAPDGDSE